MGWLSMVLLSPVLAKVWLHNPEWWPSMVGMSVRTTLLELALMVTDMGFHSLMLLQHPAEPA